MQTDMRSLYNRRKNEQFDDYYITLGGDMANAPFSLLERVFGIDAYIALDHANGIEPTTIADIKAYKPSTKSYFSSEILPRDYERLEDLIVLKEMTDRLALKMINEEVRASGLTINIKFCSHLSDALSKCRAWPDRPHR